MKEIVVASKNNGKVAEFAAALKDLPVRIVPLAAFGDIPEAVEDGETFVDNALIKAKFYAHHTGKACLADDSGLEVDALHGRPGVYSARYAGENASDAQNNTKLLDELAHIGARDRTARFRCALAFVDCDGHTITSEGACEGVILTEARGAAGFGYDPLFYVSDLKCTLAEIDIAHKNAISHRGAAIRTIVKKMVEYLK